MIDKSGFRIAIGIILANEKKEIFLAKRIGQNAWQFPQGGVLEHESPEQAMYRELGEETGLQPEDVEIMGCSRTWLYYRLPKKMIRYYSKPLCIGQKQKWYLLKFIGDEKNFRFDLTNSPEFDGFKWVSYWEPLRAVISFKKKVYKKALKEFRSLLFSGKDKNE